MITADQIRGWRMQFGSLRRRGDRVFVLGASGPARLPLEDLADQHPGAFVTWETQGLGVPLGGGRLHRTGPRFALWVPAPLAELADPRAPLAELQADQGGGGLDHFTDADFAALLGG